MPLPSINPSLERSSLVLCLISRRLCPHSIRITRFQWQRWSRYMACNPYQQRENGSAAGVVGATGLFSIQCMAGRLSTKVVNRLPGAQCQIPACSTGLSRPRSQQTPYINHPRQTGGLVSPPTKQMQNQCFSTQAVLSWSFCCRDSGSDSARDAKSARMPD